MKKTIYMLALAALALSCAKEIDQNSAVGGKKVTISVGLSDAEGTKVSLTEASDKKSMSLAWEASDAISINGETFTIKEGFSTHEAEFEGNAPSGDSYTIIYPGKYSSAEAFNARSYVSQTQTGNSSTAHLEYNAMLSGVTEYATPKFDPDWASDKGGSLTQNGILQLRLQLPENASSASSVVLSASRAIFPTTNAGTELTKDYTLALTDVTLPANKILEAYLMVSAAGVTIQDGDELTLAVDTPEGVFLRKVVLQAQTWTGGNQYTLQLKVQEDNVFEISTVDDLLEFRDGVNSGSLVWQKVTAKLMNDIDCSSVSSWTPIGNGTFTPVESGTVSATWEEPAFKGTFDGQNHAIKNLHMEGTPETYKPYGLFGLLYGATVKNLVLGAESGDMGALIATPQERMDAGAVAGAAFGATVQNVTNYFPMTIPANSSANRVSMGMVGYVYGDATSGPSTIIGLDNYGKVNATQSPTNTGNGLTSVQVAGIAGFGNSGAGAIVNEIKYSTNYAKVDANTARSAGVLAAANTRTNLTACANRGVIDNTYSGDSRIGGITVILGSGSTLSDCHNYAKVTASSSSANIGGLVCLLNAPSSLVTDCSNEGEVSSAAASYLGGIAANVSEGTITLCVNTGNVTGVAYVGGIAGRLGNGSGWVYINKCRSDATITSTTDASSCAGGIVGQMRGGVLNTCSAKGTVVAAGYDVGGIVGQMYCNQSSGDSSGRQYVYDCLSAADVTTTRASGSANLGGVVGRIIRKNDKNNTGQYMAVDNCIGLNQTLTATLNYVGAFAGNVTASVKTNYQNVRVRNCISLVEDSNYHATGTANTGGFVGALPYGLMYYDFYVVSNNTQNIDATYGDVSNLTKSDAATLTSTSFCEEHSARAIKYFLNVNEVRYASSGWVIPDGVSYPVPSTLAALGSEYYK